MPKPTLPLTAKFCNAAICPSGISVKKFGDAGSGLTFSVKRISQNDFTKTFTHEYSFSGKRKKIVLGTYPIMTISEARSKLIEIKRSLQSGIDPVQARRAKVREISTAAENSFASVFDRWYETWKHRKATTHASNVLKRAQADILPGLGAKPIAEVTTQDIVQIVRRIDARGIGGLARRALSCISQVMDFAALEGIVKHNPAAPIKPRLVLRKHEVEHMPRVAPRDVPQLLRDVCAFKDTNASETTVFALRLLPHVFLRGSELVGGLWIEIDWDRKIWRIPKERMKMSCEHIVPLSRQVISILLELHKDTGDGELMFPGRGRRFGKVMTTNCLLFALYRMGYKGRQSVHGFRAIASTELHEQGFNHHWIELQLSHMEQNEVVAAYNSAKHLRGRTEMMQAWSDWIDGAQAVSSRELVQSTDQRLIA
jgi:integrase